ncbi:MAG: LuxR C-terminal-related transcriptional regulator [Anaerolineaceae bacterium]
MDSQQLSDREIEILLLVAQAKSNKEIASELFISVNTVKVHIANIFQKLEVNSRTEATVTGIEKGLISIPERTNGLSKDPKSLDEVITPEKLPAFSNFQKSNRYSLLILLIIILVMTITIFTLLQRDRPNQETTLQSKWQKLSNLPTIHLKPAIAVVDSLIYVIGGDSKAGPSSKMDRYNPKLDDWETLIDKPTPVSLAKAVVIGNKIYVPGGKLSNGQATNVLEVFDPDKLTWTERSKLPNPIYNYGLSVFENKIYLFGGQNEQRISWFVYVYDPIADEWFEETTLNSPGSLGLGIVQLKDKFILFGGSDGKQNFDKVSTYSPLASGDPLISWRQIATLPKDTKPDTAQLAGDFIFMLGKRGVWQFLPQNNEWILQSYQDNSMNTSEETVIASDGYLFRIGGIDSNGEISTEFHRYQVVYSVVLPNIYN